MPEASADFRTWTVRIQPGIYFADDPAFKGKKREVVAQDFVYAFQRIADPANKSPLWGLLETVGLRRPGRGAQGRARRARSRSTTTSRSKACARSTATRSSSSSSEPRPRFLESLAGSDLFGAQAREVVEFYGDKIVEHPVGTGPFRLKQWRRSSLIVLETQPRLPRRALRRRARRRRRRGPGAAGPLQGPQAADDRRGARSRSSRRRSRSGCPS